MSDMNAKVMFTWVMILFNHFLSAQHHKRLYIANDDHTDYMWSANEAAYDSAFINMLDYYLQHIDSTKNEAEDFQTRFNCDGSYWLKVYEKRRSPQQFMRLIERIRSGHISSPLNSVVSTYGGQPMEAIIRGMYHAGKLERRFNLRFHMAVAMENQTLPLGLSALWAGSGAKYSWKGVCACATKVPYKNFQNRRNQLYNYTGLDSSHILMKWYNLGQNNTFLGGYAEVRGGQKPKDAIAGISSVITTLDKLCDDAQVNVKYPYKVAGGFGYGWDDLATFAAPAFITAAKNMNTAQSTVRVSNEEDFFKDVEKNYQQLPTETVSYGNEWDLYPASMNETTAKVKRAIEKLRTAEALAAAISFNEKNSNSHLHVLKEKAWEAIGLYWEHNWTADGPISRKERAAWQVQLQQQISAYADTLYKNGMIALGKQIRSNNRQRFFVFNPLGWMRNDVVDIEYNGNRSAKVIDATTLLEVPSQIIIKNSQQFIRIQANNIPSVGFKVFEIKDGKPGSYPAAATFNGTYLSNINYRIRLSRSGAITELYDKLAGNRQLVKLTNSLYLNDLGTTDINNGDALVVENQGPVSVTLKAVSRNPVLHNVRMTVFAGSPRVEIENQINENFSDVKTWAYSFNLNNHTTRHEELGAILTAKKENNGGHYAAQNARYDWLTFNHFVNLSENDYGITLSNQDCSFFKLGSSTPDSLWENSAQVNALAGGQTDGEKLGIIAQNGTSLFNYKFAFCTNRNSFNATQAMKFSLEHQNPLVAGKAFGSSALPQVNSYSLLSITNPDVLLWSVKPSEDGNLNELIVRLWNMKTSRTTTKLNFKNKLIKSARVSHIETQEEELKSINNLSIQFNPNQVVSYKLVTQKKNQR